MAIRSRANLPAPSTDTFLDELRRQPTNSASSPTAPRRSVLQKLPAARRGVKRASSQELMLPPPRKQKKVRTSLPDVESTMPPPKSEDKKPRRSRFIDIESTFPPQRSRPKKYGEASSDTYSASLDRPGQDHRASQAQGVTKTQPAGVPLAGHRNKGEEKGNSSGTGSQAAEPLNSRVRVIPTLSKPAPSASLRNKFRMARSEK